MSDDTTRTEAALIDELDELSAESERLREALRGLVDPGADGATHELFNHSKRYLDCDVPGCVIERERFRAARALLESETPQ